MIKHVFQSHVFTDVISIIATTMRTFSAGILMLFTGKKDHPYAHSMLHNHNKTSIDASLTKGYVTIVGAGPGDPELLTMKAVNAIMQADAVLYDWLVDPQILALIPAHVDSVFVGKKCGQHSMTQASICDLMVDMALQKKRVVRLKGGDPAIFARTAEECSILTAHDIPFSIVPGITAASGMSASTGIPLTHRDCAQSVRFVTAHLKQQTYDHASDQYSCWPQLSQLTPNETLVVYMGLRALPRLVEHLLTLGAHPSEAVAVVDKATQRDQLVCTGSLSNIVSKSEQVSLSGPALIVIGDVVKHRYKLAENLIKLLDVNDTILV